jgi:hypothetical protein
MKAPPQNHRIADLNRTLEGIYDDYRTVLLNSKYNGIRLQRAIRWNRGLEVLIAVGASGSGIAGLTLWKSDYGQYGWGAISVSAILVSIIKPIWNLGREIEEYSQLWAEYATLSARYRNAIRQIEGARDQIAASGTLPQKLVEEIDAIRAKMVELAPRGDQHPSRRLVDDLQSQINAEVPPAALWVAPTEEG